MNITNIQSLYLFIFILYHKVHSDTVAIPSNCVGLSDGYYYLKLLDEYPIIYAGCHNEYIILDHSLDSDISLYFTSFTMYHTSVAGPSNQYQINWNEWLLPSSDNYLISPDCHSCDASHTRQIYSDNTVYMMTGTMFGCYWSFPYSHSYDQDYNTYQCYYDTQSTDTIPYPLTDTSSKYDWDHSGVCAFNVRSANMQFESNNMEHESCTINDIVAGYHLKPSIGTDGHHCICVQPSNTGEMQVNSLELKDKQQIQMQSNSQKSIMEFETNEQKQSSVEAELIYYLYNTDFEYGTYRIQKPGRYVLMEDIVFNPNTASDYYNVNDDMKAWRPHMDQSDTYPGAEGYHNPYFMGFWAAITIETDDVILDLNDHSIVMDRVFYYQQRWFTIIALTSQYYLPGQGIGFFGANPSFASNIIIKDGTLGLTSHHCIHGNFNKNILIEHILCRDFETHGIQLNGFEHITIRNVEIGPSSTTAYLRGEYGHARALLPRLKKVADENPTQSIKFDGRDTAVTMAELTEELTRQMNAIFEYVYNGNAPEPSSDWNEILDLFYNPSGLPNGGAMYGIYLNTAGESVMGYNLDTTVYSSHAILNNIQIHDLRHNMREYIRVSTKTSNPFGSVYVNPLSAPYDALQMFESIDSNDLKLNPRYKGSIMTDVLFALSEFTDNWDYLQNQLIFKDYTLPWAKGQDLNALNGNLNIGCNNDAMLQSGKGVMGIRMDGIQNAKLSHIEIYNLFAETQLGLTECGEYNAFNDGGHISQKLPMQTGFSGNNLAGMALSACDNIKISNINIHSLQSHTGDALGMALWPSVNVLITGDINMHDIHAGWLIPEQLRQLQWDSLPNRAPMGCGILNMNQFYSAQTGVMYHTNVNSQSDSALDIKVSNVYGFVFCDGSADIKTMVGEYVSTDDNAKVGIDSESDTVSDDSDLDTDAAFEEYIKPSSHHILVGTIIACSILFCGLVTMGYIAYVYCKHKRQQKDTEERAQLLLQQSLMEQQSNTENTQENIQLQTGTSNYQSFPGLTQSNAPNNNNDIQEEETEQNERTPLIKRLPVFDRCNL